MGEAICPRQLNLPRPADTPPGPQTPLGRTTRTLGPCLDREKIEEAQLGRAQLGSLTQQPGNLQKSLLGHYIESTEGGAGAGAEP